MSICVSDLQAYTVLPWPKLEHKGLTLGQKRPMNPRTTKRPPAESLRTAGKGLSLGNHIGTGGGDTWVMSQALPGMTVNQPDWLASPM